MEVKAGYNILWKGKGPVFTILSLLLGLTDSTWRKRKWKPWHVGYVVTVLEDGWVVTSQAVANGIEAISYPSAEDLGDCRVYPWLDNPDQAKIETYTEEHLGWPYDVWGYLWVILGALSEKFLHRPFRIVDKAKMCWENLSECDRFMGKELQPEEEPCLISKMITTLESKGGSDATSKA